MNRKLPAVRTSMHRTSRWALTALALTGILLASCRTTPESTPTASVPATAVAPSAAPIPGGKLYRVDSGATRLHILVYRGGAMARLGHNHVLSSTEVTGSIELAPDLSQSRVELSLPVNTLIVDDAAARRMESEDFSAEVPQDARDGTRRNLLRAEVLDGEHFPTVGLRAVAVAGSRTAPTLTMRITLKGATRDVVVPAVVTESGSNLTATGQFEIKQTDFGITPFSIGLGALQVQDLLKIKFTIVAKAD